MFVHVVEQNTVAAAFTYGRGVVYYLGYDWFQSGASAGLPSAQLSPQCLGRIERPVNKLNSALGTAQRSHVSRLPFPSRRTNVSARTLWHILADQSASARTRCTEHTLLALQDPTTWSTRARLTR
jgi:hypothetical protein